MLAQTAMRNLDVLEVTWTWLLLILVYRIRDAARRRREKHR